MNTRTAAMKIIITGSLGHIGKPLAMELVKKGHIVTVISSKPEKQKEIEALGAVASIGSLEDTDYLTDAFTGADAVYAMIPPNFTEPDPVQYYSRLAQNYAHAIRQAGIKRVVHLSSWGAHLSKGTGFILGSYHSESILNELSDVAVTHLRAGYFYYNLYNFVDMIKGTGFIASNYGGSDKIIMVAPEDIATTAAEALIKPVTHTKVEYVVSDEHTANEVARILGAAIGKPDLEWITVTDQQMQSSMEQHGLPDHIIINSVEVGASIHSGALRQDYELHKPIHRGNVKLEDFAKEFAAVFHKR